MKTNTPTTATLEREVENYNNLKKTRGRPLGSKNRIKRIGRPLGSKNKVKREKLAFSYPEKQKPQLALLKTPSGFKQIKLIEKNQPLFLGGDGSANSCMVFEILEKGTSIHNERGAGRHEVPLEFPKGLFTSEAVLAQNKMGNGAHLSESAVLSKIRKALQNEEIKLVGTAFAEHQGRPFRIYQTIE